MPAPFGPCNRFLIEYCAYACPPPPFVPASAPFPTQRDLTTVACHPLPNGNRNRSRCCAGFGMLSHTTNTHTHTGYTHTRGTHTHGAHMSLVINFPPFQISITVNIMNTFAYGLSQGFIFFSGLPSPSLTIILPSLRPVPSPERFVFAIRLPL